MPGQIRPPRARVVPAAVPTARLAEVTLSRQQEVLPLWPGRTVSVGEYELFVRTTPAGPDAEPALYVHGLGGSSTNWTDLASDLAPRLAGDAIDLPGFGRSFPPPDDDVPGVLGARP